MKEQIDINAKDMFELLEKSTAANVTNAESTRLIAETQRELHETMRTINDQFVLHNLEQNNINKEITVIRAELIRYIKVLLIIIFSLLGGIIFLRALGLDIINLITNTIK